MTDYQAPIADISFTLRELAGLSDLQALDDFTELTDDVVAQVLEEAGRFASDVWAPLNQPGDEAGCRVSDRKVELPDGFGDAYRAFVDAGWQSLEFAEDIGGMGLPGTLAAATFEMFQSANLALSLCPMLTGSAVHAVAAHAPDWLKAQFLPRLVTGEWTGTMCLTEPQAGSDLSAVKTRAVPDGDHFSITGTKIYITWGDHDFPGNIAHLVLARLPDAPEGVRGISMFLVPKYLVEADGSLGARNDVYPVSTEHKLGIHASPTCVMNFGDGEGATGYLVGEANKGLAAMFTMMNHARLHVGIQGLAIAERAYQQARAYAKDRVQGRVPGKKGRVPIVEHADVRRMLMLMKSLIEAMRAVAYRAAAWQDIAHHTADENERARAAARVGLLTPVVKGWLTETAQELTALGVQIHGGMGYVEETGAAQHLRDARILTIYEGTTGIQASDLVGRKILRDEGRAVDELIEEMRASAGEIDGQGSDEFEVAIDDFAATVQSLLDGAGNDARAEGAAGFNALMQLGILMGAWQMLRSSDAANATESSGNGTYNHSFLAARKATAAFYIAHVLPRALAYGAAARSDSATVMGVPVEDL